METSINPIYFYHIPKTSGRFLYVNLFLILEHELLSRGIDYGDILKGYGHRSFKDLDSNQIVGITILREPIERTISHYLHLLNVQLSDDTKTDKEKFINFLLENPNHEIINYQTKYISYSGNSESINLYDNLLSSEITNFDLNIAKERVSKINYIFNMGQQGEELIKYMRLELCNHLNITLSTEVENTKLCFQTTVNPESKYLHESLTNTEKNIIQNIMNYDMNLYYSTKFTSFS
jgi:hypothetical protein